MTEEENNKSESKEEQPKFNQQHYDRLIECSKKGPEGIKGRFIKIVESRSQPALG